MSKQLVIIPIHGMLAALLPLAQCPKNSNRSGGAHKSRKSDASKQNKKMVLIIVDYNTKSKASYKNKRLLL
jgi:hypothetical protein